MSELARQAVLDVLAERDDTLLGICRALWDSPGYWDAWPTVESVLKQLQADGVVKRRGARGSYWTLVA